MGIGSLSSQGGIGEGTNVVNIYLGIWFHGENTSLETIHVQLGITSLNRTHNADHIALAQGCRHHTIDKTTLLRSSLISKDIRLTEGIHGRAPGKASLREVWRNFL